MFSVNLKDISFQVQKNGDSILVNDQTLPLDIKWIDERRIHLIRGKESLEAELVSIDRESKTIRIRLGHQVATLELKDRFDLLLEKMGMSAAGAGVVKDIKAPMPGLILDLKVKAGDQVKKGDIVLILEAMKMENIIKAPGDGVVKEVKVSLKQSVEKNQVLIQF
ncbi:biotin carboxyl carrier protein [Algoriphagus boseongensis]|uniref:Biotin carboxyl carrier protein n=1 Tax=Algoriphagus boseongensis TaxID=1442587 RepID=A0A4R6T2F8_9BACT|nr:acetyl-CoA carboxylase biotin carboxyl carrier protein subunit [Algoriphagus boseongensis]TDQ14706.1 biotin carboxyl carrier protein [Algoriphagus boseongensis]